MKSTKLQSVANIIFIASGKGGVGKSTVATNLSLSLSKQGKKVGLLDADLYGPSIPITFGLEDAVVESEKIDDTEFFIPPISQGVKIMSIGFFVSKLDAVVWRGPMATKGLTQLIHQTKWEDLDFLIIDMPPGTGDIAISLAQELPQAKALVVITPQELAVADGIKAVNMFQSSRVNIPIIGIIENMAFFTPSIHPNEKYYLFGKGGGEVLAKIAKSSVLIQIPIVEKGNDTLELDNAYKVLSEKLVNACAKNTMKIDFSKVKLF